MQSAGNEYAQARHASAAVVVEYLCDETVHCFRCDYSLCGLKPSALCPECAWPVRESIRAFAVNSLRKRSTLIPAAELLCASSYAAISIAPLALLAAALPILIPVVVLVALLAFGLFASGGFGLPDFTASPRRPRENRVLISWTIAPFASLALMAALGPVGLVLIIVSMCGLQTTVLRRVVHVATHLALDQSARFASSYNIAMIVYFILSSLGAIVLALGWWVDFQIAYGAPAPSWAALVRPMPDLFLIGIWPWATFVAIIWWVSVARDFRRAIESRLAGKFADPHS